MSEEREHLIDEPCWCDPAIGEDEEGPYVMHRNEDGELCGPTGAEYEMKWSDWGGFPAGSQIAWPSLTPARPKRERAT